CGPNSTYALLRLNNKDVKYADLIYWFSDSSPSSLLEIRQCLLSFGLDSEARHIGPQVLGDCQVPFIAHFNGGRDAIGHFVVVTVVTPDQVEVIDGTTARIEVLPRHEFEKAWSGYVIVPVRAGKIPVALFAIGGLIGVMALLMI